ncbi:MAG TPA: DUF5818 domain-containing protein [Candidatus Acidoferrum sp.]|nr:DUF5818 domain-containing protein [Candidatus Acidoferrum sp.]
MKNPKKILAALAFMAASLLAAEAAPKTFEGQIMDSTCAKMGSHEEGYKLTNTHTPKACTLACAGAGAKFVLYDSATKTTYQLDNQSEAKKFAGEKVSVVGTVNPKTDTIHVEKLQSAS